MLRRWICAILVLALALSVFYVAKTTDDQSYRAGASEEAPDGNAAEAEGVTAPAYTDDGSLTLWYTDDALTEYLTGVALSFQQDQGIKVNIEKKDGVQFLEEINKDSLLDPKERSSAPCDLYITSHDSLLRAYLSGLASIITDPDQVVTPEMYPQTAINAVTCYDHLVAYPLYYETNFFLYNKTYMASIAQNKIEADADIAEGEEATAELEQNGAPTEAAEEISTDPEENQEGDAAAIGPSEEEDANPMGEEDATADPEVLEKLATMIPATIEDIKTFANNYDAPEAVESVFKWDVSDIFYN